MIDPLNCVVSGYTGNEYSVSSAVYRTDDGGASWTNTHWMSERVVEDAAFSSVVNGVIVGRMPEIFHTQDGGHTWVPREKGTIRPLYGVSFSDPLNGTAVGYDRDDGAIILRTVDGGLTWSVQYEQNPVP
jgi:photosystem II stability/assembly factor-like uncharacterized protein